MVDILLLSSPPSPPLPSVATRVVSAVSLVGILSDHVGSLPLRPVLLFPTLIAVVLVGSEVAVNPSEEKEN